MTTERTVSTPRDSADAVNRVVRRWWGRFSYDRGARAQLRRFTDVDDVISTEAFARLFKGLTGVSNSPVTPYDVERIAASAVLVARLPSPRNDDESDAADESESGEKARARIVAKDAFFRALAAPRTVSNVDHGSRDHGGPPRYSTLRFTSLLRISADDGAALIRGFSRALDMLDEPAQVDPALMFNLVFNWNKPSWRREAATAYWTVVIDNEPKERRA